MIGMISTPAMTHCDYCHRLGLVGEVLCFECNRGAMIDHGIETIKNRMNIPPIIASAVAEDIAVNRGGEGETIWNFSEKKSGYVVGGRIPELVFPWDTEATLIGELVSDHFAAHRTVVVTADCAGWWKYKGNIHVDVNDWVEDRALAVALGKAREQISIWDIANGCEIVL